MAAAVALAVMAAGCTDSRYDLDNISPEITVGGDEVIIPLGTLDEKSLDELLDIDGLGSDENGNLYYRFDGEADSFTVETMSVDPFRFDDIDTEIVVDYPEFGDTTLKIDISTPDFKGEVPAAGPSTFDGTLNFSNNDGAYAFFDVELDTPDMVGSVDNLYLGDNGKGAPVTATFALNGLNGIAEGVNMEIALKFPKGYKFLDDKQTSITETADGITVARTVTEADADGNIEFTVNILEMDLAQIGDLSQNNIYYTFNLDLDCKAGQVGTEAPCFKLFADTLCTDADVTTAATPTEIDQSQGSEVDIDYTFTDIANVKSVTAVNFTAGSRLLLTLGEGSNFPKALAKYLDVEILFPDFCIFAPAPAGADYKLDGQLLTAKLDRLRSGIELALTGADCSQQAVDNGTIALEGQVVTTIRVPAAQHLKLADIKPADTSAPVGIAVSLVSEQIEIASIEGVFDFEQKLEAIDVDLGDMDLLDIDVSRLGISPVLEFNLTNPVSADLVADLTLTPHNGNLIDAGRKVTVSGIKIAGGATSQIVIADQSHSGQYAGRQFVAADLSKLLEGELPSSILLEATVRSTDEPCILELGDGPSEAHYDYAVTIPFEIDAKASADYTYKIENISEELESVEGIKIKQVGIAAKFENRIPLDLTLDVVPLDSEGKPLPASVLSINIPAGSKTIKASADGKTAQSSSLAIGLNIPSGDLADLKQLDALEVTFSIANGADRTVALNKSQTLSGVFTLCINGGITIDIDKVGANE